MTFPSNIIDASLSPLSNAHYFVIEKDKIWRTTNLDSEGAATWEVCFDASTEFPYGTWDSFARVVCAHGTGIVYAVGAAKKPGQGTNNYTAYVLRSANWGEDWVIHEVTEFTTSNMTFYSYSGLVTVKESVSCEPGFPKKPERPLSPGGDCTYVSGENGEYAAIKACNSGDAYVTYDLGRIVTGDSITVQWDREGDVYIYVSEDGSTWQQVLYGRYSWAEPCKSQYVSFPGGPKTYRYIKFFVHEIGTIGDIIRLAYWGWNDLSSILRISAFDVARTNVNWLYLGVIDVGILQSTDGGTSWHVFDDDNAVDILVDPLLAGVIYFFTDTETLVMRSATGQFDVIYSSLQGKYFVPCRIAKSLNSGKLWFMPNGTSLYTREMGVQTQILSGKTGMRGIHAYIGDKVILCENSSIYLSDDGDSFVQKTGNWSTYSAGKQAHRFRDA